LIFIQSASDKDCLIGGLFYQINNIDKNHKTLYNKCKYCTLICVIIGEGPSSMERKYPMDDKQILSLYLARDEQAITETDKKYGKLCFAIAKRILSNEETAKECVNDTYLKAWNSIPPKEPLPLSPYLAVISRNCALSAYRKQHSEGRGGEHVAVAFEELSECLSDSEPNIAHAMDLSAALDDFLSSLPKRTRIIFLRRYWYLCAPSEIALSLGISENNVGVILHRTRKQLKTFLEKRGIRI